MEEKKLTDEQKALIQEIKDAVAHLKKFECDFTEKKMVVLEYDLLTYIVGELEGEVKRLQSENAGLKERGEIVINSLHETIAEQKAEIERLTEKYEDKLAWQEVDIQQLTEENAELQKQVDEYKAKLPNDCIVLYKEDAEAYRIWEEKYGRPRYIDGCMTAYAHRLQTAEHLVQQAVKDTAKEIYGLAVMYYDGSGIDSMFLNELEERYGVEVE